MSLQFTKYLLSGALGTAVHYTLMWCLVSISWIPTAATGIGAIAGALTNYFLCRYVVFNGQSVSLLQAEYAFPAESLFRFLVVASIMALTNSLCFFFLYQNTASIPIAQLISTGCVLPVGYLLNKRWSFARQRTTLPGQLS